MLSVPTLWLVFVMNFAALALMWATVIRAYPQFIAGRYWCASAGVAVCGALLGLMRGAVDSVFPLVAGGGVMVFACCLIAMGLERYYGRAPSWRASLALVAVVSISMAIFSLWIDNIAARILIYSVGQVIPTAYTLKFLPPLRNGERAIGPWLAAAAGALLVCVYAARAIAAMLQLGGEVDFLYFNTFQAALLVAILFLSLAWIFGLLLMTVERLRADVAGLALLDELTGIPNRRLLLQRIGEQCAMASRSHEPFSLIAIDLDGFKTINDGFGHAAGDECLRRFTRAVQTCIRPGDLFARIGGDEFCVMMPATTWREGAMIARRILDACAAASSDSPAPIGASIGVAQWTPELGAAPAALIAAADEALYQAKNQGKNRYVAPAPAGAIAAEPEPLRRSA